jgi:hypothetical protein
MNDRVRHEREGRTPVELGPPAEIAVLRPAERLVEAADRLEELAAHPDRGPGPLR